MNTLRRNIGWLAVRVVATAAVLLFVGPFWSRSDLLRLANDKASSPWQQLGAGSQEARIAVVLVDDADLKELKVSWPLPYTHWARLLRNLGCTQVQAIFFSVLLARDEEFKQPGALGQESLKEVDRRVSRGALSETDCRGLPGPFAPVSVLYGYADTPGAWLSSDVENERKLPVKWQGIGGDYPLRIADGAEMNRQSAAYFLYRLICGNQVSPLPPGCAERLSENELNERLIPRWSMQAPKGQEELSGQRCENSVPDSVAEAFRQWIVSWLRDTAPTSCPPFLTLNVRDLLQMDARTVELLRGRVVLLGSDVSGAGERTFAETHWQMPGVYLHAVALENLLDQGRHFDRINELEIRIATVAVIVVAALAHWTVLWGIRRWRWNLPGWFLGFVVVPGAWGMIAIVLRQFLEFPPGMIGQAALMMSLGLLLGELGQEGKWYGWLLKLQPDLGSSPRR